MKNKYLLLKLYSLNLYYLVKIKKAKKNSPFIKCQILQIIGGMDYEKYKEKKLVYFYKSNIIKEFIFNSKRKAYKEIELNIYKYVYKDKVI